MNRIEYMGALRSALAALPPEDLANALRYYEEYFDDAGEENEAQVISELGAPEKIAAQILEDYKELTISPNQQANSSYQEPQNTAYAKAAQSAKGLPLAIWIIIAIFAVPILVPCILAVVITVVSLAFAAVCLLLALALVPICLAAAGIAVFGFSFALWFSPASALVTLGTGIALFAVGLAGTVAMIKACIVCIPAIVRGFVAVCRWPFDKFRSRGGAV